MDDVNFISSAVPAIFFVGTQPDLEILQKANLVDQNLSVM